MPIRPASAKAKGRALQQWVCIQISELLGIPWGPDELIASRESGQSGTDVRLIGLARELFPFSIECKAQETWKIPEWIQQAQANQQPGTDWLLFVKKSRKRPVVIMDAERFFDLLRRVGWPNVRNGKEGGNNEAMAKHDEASSSHRPNPSALRRVRASPRPPDG